MNFNNNGEKSLQTPGYLFWNSVPLPGQFYAVLLE